MVRIMALGMEWSNRRESTPLSVIVERVQNVSRGDIESALKRFPLNEWSEYRLLPE